MTPFQWTLLAVAGLLLVWMLLKRRGDITPEAAKQLVSEGALLLDVRTAAEFSSGHLPGATNIPLGELGSRLKKLEPKDRAIVVYCLSGTRSAAAAGTLKGAGFEKVANLGAMSRW
jgi:phage shock protein E